MIKIPNHVIKKELGKSSMATVYLAENTILNHDVFLRIMHPDNAQNTEFRHHFLAVGKRVSYWKHPHIGKIYDVGITGDNIFYSSMEYLEKGNLREKIANKKNSLAALLKIIKEVGEALSYIHNQGFIHGNLKLDSILFDHEGKTKLLDNGCTELKQASGDLALQDNLHYMSPEQAALTKLDQRTDIYSLGLIVYEMLVGEKAFYADTTAEAIYQHAMLAPPDLPDEYRYLQPVLDKALAKSPSDRYTTVEEMLQALEVSIDTFTINRIDNQVKIKHTKTEKETSKNIYVKHQSVYVENQSVYVSHRSKQKQFTKPWLLGGVLTGFLVLLALLVLLFNNIITGDDFKNKQIISDSAQKEGNDTYITPVSFVEKNEPAENDDRNKKNNKSIEAVVNEGVNPISFREKAEKEEGHDRNKKTNKISNEEEIASTEKKTVNSDESPLEKKRPPSNNPNIVPTSKILINTFAKKDKKTLKATIKIVSKETNKIIFDSKNIAPSKFELEVGEYQLRIEHKGYITQSKLLKIKDIEHDELIIDLAEKSISMGGIKVHAVSKRNEKSLHATYEIRGIDSKYHYKQTKKKSAYFKLPVGKYTLFVGYKDKMITKYIRIRKNKTIHEKVAFSLPREKAKKTEKKLTTTNPPKKITGLGYIHISAKLDHEKGRNLPANFFLYRNKKIVKKALQRNRAKFQVPTGKYVIKVMYKGVSSNAKVVVDKGDIIEQIFIYDDIPD